METSCRKNRLFNATRRDEPLKSRLVGILSFFKKKISNARRLEMFPTPQKRDDGDIRLRRGDDGFFQTRPRRPFSVEAGGAFFELTAIADKGRLRVDRCDFCFGRRRTFHHDKEPIRLRLKRQPIRANVYPPSLVFSPHTHHSLTDIGFFFFFFGVEESRREGWSGGVGGVCSYSYGLCLSLCCVICIDIKRFMQVIVDNFS